MSDFIFYSGIVAFVLIFWAIVLQRFLKKMKWHKWIGYAGFCIALLHGAVAIYKAVRLYFLYS